MDASGLEPRATSLATNSCYRDVIDYPAKTGNWTHQWVTLRNLAGLLSRGGDDASAAMLDAAADQAPDAPPALFGGAASAAPPPPAPGRSGALDIARQAIERNLAEYAEPSRARGG